MILDRLIRHFKAANWLTAFLELLIVVVGVYGAFELERWGEERREARREEVLLQQLHEEIMLAEPLMEEQVKAFAETIQVVRHVAGLLMQEAGSGELDSLQCEGLFDVSILRYNPLTLTSLDEMASSGTHSQLDDQQLKTLLFTLQQKTKDLISLVELILPQQNILMDMYPELIPRGIDSDGDTFINCDTDGMRANQGFINHLMSDIGRYAGLSSRLSEQLETLIQIHDRLDQVLKIEHAD